MDVLKTVPHSAKEAAQILHDALVGTGLTIATAESLTGGDVGGTICTVAGASEYYRGGVISYASAVKASVLGVNEELLAKNGSVDPEVARQMAQGTARICGADYGVSTTGVAGPEPHDGKPVGTVFWVCTLRRQPMPYSSTMRGIGYRFAPRQRRMQFSC